MAEICLDTKVSKDQNFIKTNMKNICNRSIAFIGIVAVWQIMSLHYNNELLLPSPIITIKEFFNCIVDVEVLKNMGITMGRVLRGFLLSLLFGLPLGFLMGYFRSVEKAMGGIIDALRQIPVMAWVPLTIVWFGIGDGPTLFLIAFSGVFPVILNTLEGVKGISSDYYNAARSMGASRFSLFKDVTLPAVIPDILTGARISISTGWMSVI
ncbi:ABC transporter permease subunit [Psychrilyobacter piezotolerans]|uniref:ABC transporter permease subunit n=2 Tax=Fusobacteriaceae TaxID=203492 RepID=A0ABX9KF68_9FUSO|nr:ABC transporter permease subunit [Psychrilyobacter piezotolerans]RDE60311.1 ABC transporter permease subunit [Psychrilyobacter sp. S5]REI40419.1 ABC transporter permease subunit [Psychrilyobacter piezotolerans]